MKENITTMMFDKMRNEKLCELELSKSIVKEELKMLLSSYYKLIGNVKMFADIDEYGENLVVSFSIKVKQVYEAGKMI